MIARNGVLHPGGRRLTSSRREYLSFSVAFDHVSTNHHPHTVSTAASRKEHAQLQHSYAQVTAAAAYQRNVRRKQHNIICSVI